MRWPDDFIDRIICGDCLDVMKQILEERIDLVLCDLPYGLTKNKWDKPLPLDRLWEVYERIIKRNGTIVLFGQGKFTYAIINSNLKLWRYNLIWDKYHVSGFLNANKRPLQQHEDIIIFNNSSATYNPQKTKGSMSHSRGKNPQHTSPTYKINDHLDRHKELGCLKHPTTILRFKRPAPSVSLHEAEKPIGLCEYLIKTYTDKGDLVLDNCAGSGSTLIAAKNLNRNFIGIEINPDYCKIAEERLSQYVLLAERRL